ncbi:MAG: DUF6580 family putative transport protein [Terrimicrobiaceae bacterium]
MKKPQIEAMQKNTLALALALVVLAAAYRVFGAVYVSALPNFSPVMAMAFCSGLVLPGALAVAAPLACLFVSDLVLNAHFGQPLMQPAMLAIYACYVFAIGTGALLRHRGLPAVFGAVLGNAFLFYLVTNSLAWWGNSHYAQTFGGWIQALTVGQAGFAPTWTFFRNSLIGDFLFTAMFLALFYWARKRSASPNLARQESSS